MNVKKIPLALIKLENRSPGLSCHCISILRSCRFVTTTELVDLIRMNDLEVRYTFYTDWKQSCSNASLYHRKIVVQQPRIWRRRLIKIVEFVNDFS
jgi:hypothetical protein